MASVGDERLIWAEVGFQAAIPAFVVATVLQMSMSFVLFGTILLSPLFLQELMGYSAWKAGLTLAPRGLAAMFSMLLMGQLSRTRINTRAGGGRLCGSFLRFLADLALGSPD